jgi:hypothetical protein
MLAVLSFNAADDVAAGAHQHVIMLAMVDEHGGCGLVYWLLCAWRRAPSRPI